MSDLIDLLEMDEMDTRYLHELKKIMDNNPTPETKLTAIKPWLQSGEKAAFVAGLTFFDRGSL